MKKGMIARIRNVLFALFRRFDHWLLLRAPMLWRTRPVHLLVLLSLAVIATIPFIDTSIEDARGLIDLAANIEFWWSWQVIGSVVVLALWVRSITRKPVGELMPHRHIVTVVAVGIGSYLWLVAPSLLAYPQFNAIARFGPNDQALTEDFSFLSRHSSWVCVPPAVWDKGGELKQLRDVLAHYGYQEEPRKGKISQYVSCHRDENFPLDAPHHVEESKDAIQIIGDARALSNVDFIRSSELISLMPRSTLVGSFWWFAAAALGIGILTAILSYPLYVWRRTFGRN